MRAPIHSGPPLSRNGGSFRDGGHPVAEQPILRQAVRAILLTPQDEVLLMRLRADGKIFWITPGGGIEAGETALEALHRELGEEVGLLDARIGPLVWRRRQTTTYYKKLWQQSEDYFLVETERFVPHMRDEAEARLVTEFRWWHLDELAEADEVITPLSLGKIVSDYLDHGAPDPLPPTEVVVD